MKTSTILSSIAVLTLAATVGCGLQPQDTSTPSAPPVVTTISGGDAGSGGDTGTGGDAGSAGDSGNGGSTPDGGTPAVSNVDVFMTSGPCDFNFSQKYISDATTGEVRGTMPLMTWTSGLGLADDNGDGYIGMTWTSTKPVGTFEVSYVGFQGANTNPAWAQYGAPEQVAAMSDKGRAYVKCNWYDATSKSMVTVTNPSCDIAYSVDEACNITPAGNMGNFASK